MTQVRVEVTFVPEQAFQAQSPTQGCPVGLRGRADRQPPVRGSKRLVGSRALVCGARRLRDGARGKEAAGLPDRERNARLEQGHVDVLALPGLAALVQRGLSGKGQYIDVSLLEAGVS